MNRLSLPDLGIVLVYLLTILYIGLRAAKKIKNEQEDFLLAGRTLTLPLFVVSLVPTFYGGVLGVGEYTYRYGISNWLVLGVPYYLLAGIYAFFFAGRIRLTPGMTIADHLGKIYGKPMALMAAGLIFILATPAPDVLMLGTLLHWISGWPMLFCALAVSALAIAYIYAGGLRSDVWTNVLQFAVMFLGFASILPFAYKSLGGWESLSLRLPALHLSWHGGNSPGFILTWYLIALWTLVDPGFHQRCCAAQNPETARRGILLSIPFWFFFDFMTTAAGLYARVQFPELDNPLLAYPLLAQVHLPSVWKGLFFAGMISSMLAALEAHHFISAITLARDFLGRIKKLSEEEEKKWVQRGLLIASAVAIFLAFEIPSVVRLWYVIGSTTIPGLLLPLVSVYWPKMQIQSGWALAASIAGWGTSLAFFLLSPVPNPQSPGPAAIEPMIPGLAASVLLWVLGLLRGRRDHS